MSLAQKKARENFKKAIAYRKKTGCTLKQAFSHVKGGKVTGVKKAVKKVAKKKAVPVSKHKDTKSHNVNIRVVSGIKNKLFKEIEVTKNLIIEQTELLQRLQTAYKKSNSKINKQMLLLDIKTLKNNFIPHNKKRLKYLQVALKKSI